MNCKCMQPNMANNHMSDEEVMAFLGKKKEGVLSTIGTDGYPYGTPVNYIVYEGKIYFHGRKVGEKVGNINACNKVCLTVMDFTGFEQCGPDGNNTTTIYESVIVRGSAVLVEDEQKKTEILRATIDTLVPERKADPINPKAVGPAAVYEVVIDSATGKFHRPMPGNKVMN